MMHEKKIKSLLKKKITYLLNWPTFPNNFDEINLTFEL